MIFADEGYVVEYLGNQESNLGCYIDFQIANSGEEMIDVTITLKNYDTILTEDSIQLHPGEEEVFSAFIDNTSAEAEGLITVYEFEYLDIEVSVESESGKFSEKKLI